ncbi:MAG: hypothetical protein R2733_08475 [Acidimicrobiales bacterium]
MNDGTTDTMRVVFPAAERFVRVGRVAMAGLALRLEIDVQQVEQLRLAVDEAVGSLAGDGTITVEARWEPGRLNIDINNSDAHLGTERQEELAGILGGLVDEASIGASHVGLVLEDAS